jgi:hypothetical protein
MKRNKRKLHGGDEDDTEGKKRIRRGQRVKKRGLGSSTY